MNHLKDLLISSLSKLKGIILFLVISAIVIGGWKLAHLDDYLVVWIAGLFNRLIFVEIHISHFFIREVMGFQSNLSGDVITMPNGSALLMNPGCTGFKQVVQLCIIMLVYPGPIRKKAWYIPVASFVLFLSSIMHFVLLAVLIDKFPLHFAFFHDHLSRWIYFTIFFLAWLVWEDYVRNPKSRKI